MTLDVAIGKITVSQYEEDGHAHLYIEQCPDAKQNICNPDFTICPKGAYRSGSAGFWQFWKGNDKLSSIYHKLRDNPNNNDPDYTFLKQYVDDILSLSKNAVTTEIDRDRLKWLQYWVKKAVELYGDDAGIGFS